MEGHSLASTIESQAPKPTGAKINPPEALDKEGLPFNPALHVTRPDGSPDLGAGGRLKRRAGRRRRGPVGAGDEGLSQLPLPPLAVDVVDGASSAAAVTVASLVGLAAMLGGAHWQASKDERAMLTQAWTDYYRVRGVSDLPPELSLAIVLGAYGMATEERRSDLKRGVSEVIGRARPNRRNHGLGQDGMRPGVDPILPAA